MSHNPIAKAQERLSEDYLLDLTQSNPTLCGFDYPIDLLKGLSRKACLSYEPFPFGHPQARKAVSVYLASKGEKILSENIVLTASTSEAYSFLFKLLGDPGDSFLVPTPGYPLLEHLGRLEGVNTLPYPFRLEEGWPVDLAHTRERIKPHTRGIIVVNPQNPTGAFLSRRDHEKLGVLCREHGLAFISDEVFADYAYAPQSRLEAPEGVLSFYLGGLSKSLGLPQLKLSWMVLEGPPKLLEECKNRLELICDSYLSVNTPVQMALEELLVFAPRFQKQLLERVLTNRKFLEEALKAIPKAKVWPAQGGWYALVEIQGTGRSEEEWVLELLVKEKVLVQPGGFYDFPQGCFLVLSLLPRLEIFREGIRRLEKSLGQIRN